MRGGTTDGSPDPATTPDTWEELLPDDDGRQSTWIWTGAVWRAYSGIVEASAGDRVERRADPDREFERRVVATAPAGLLPPGLPT